ncbi:MAG: rRNA pseudouridine synthase [Bacteroidales bacterium]|nr:rRNA pseudouridine synthase [Bacteroidales bacterium]
MKGRNQSFKTSKARSYKPKEKSFPKREESKSTQKTVKRSGKSPDEAFEMRLNKYIGKSGLCSRREADEHIKNGLITVNGKLVTELGTKVSPNDIVKYDGSLLKSEKNIYLLLNKPKDFITTLSDKHERKTVIDLVKNACEERIYPVGRLDRNTTGVLLLTNDGDLTKQLTHPKYNKKKIYHVTLDRELSKNDLDEIAEGLTLDDGFIKVDEISYIDNDKKQIGIEIHSGKNRIVRRIFNKKNYNVKKLDRVYFSGLTKKGVQRGKWRFLTEKEIFMLKMGSYK